MTTAGPWSSAYSSAYGIGGGGGSRGGSSLIHQKKILVHVYDSSGNYIKTWDDWDTIPDFKWALNDGPGAMNFVLPRAWGLAGEPGEVNTLGDLFLGNNVKIYLVDQETGELGALLYQGKLRDYEAALFEGEIDGQLIPRTSQLADRTIDTDDGIVFTATDPTNMAKYLIDNGYMPGITWDPSNPLVGRTANQTIQRMKVRDALNLFVKIGGGSWYWRLNHDYSLTFSKSAEIPDHVLTIGKHVAGNIKFRRSNIDKKTRVIIYGAEILDPNNTDANDNQLVVERVKAIVQAPDYDPNEPLDFTYTNRRIDSSATARRLAYYFLEFYNINFIETVCTVIDSNFDSANGYDIETLKPGDVVQLKYPLMEDEFPIVGMHIVGDGHIIGGTWRAQVLKPLTIAEVHYSYTHVDLVLQLRPNRVIDELLELNDRLFLEETA